MKLLGGILIICASICSSFFYEKKLKQTINSYKDLIDILTYTKTQIYYFSKPVNQIFAEYDHHGELINELKIKRENAELDFLEPDTRKNILFLLKELGKGYKREQISLCEYNLKGLEKDLENLKTDYSKKCKIYRSVSLFFGVCAVILLI